MSNPFASTDPQGPGPVNSETLPGDGKPVDNGHPNQFVTPGMPVTTPDRHASLDIIMEG